MNKQPIDFETGDSLADFAGTGPSQGPRALPTDAGLTRIREQSIGDAPVAETFKVSCQKCGGSGRFRSYNGRDCGPCFKCEGRGHFERKTAPEKLAKARAQAGTRKANAAQTNWQAFAEQHPEAAAWMIDQAPRFEFAAEMKAKVERYGDLHPGTMAAVDRCVAREVERQASRQAGQVEQAARSIDLSATKVAEAFAKARAEGKKRIALRFDGLKIKADRSDTTKLHVTDGKPFAESTYYGKIVAGTFMPTRACTDQIKARIAEIAKDPAAAAKVFGQETGICCCCGAELTDPESRAKGIGPICETNFGF